MRSDRQTFLFSATLDGDVDVLVRRYQRDPFVHKVETPEGEEDLRRHLFWKTDRAERAAMAAQIVARHPSTVVFCRTKRGADRLARQLHQAGLSVAAIHGDRSQGQREKALAAFQSGRVQALVATDVAARGIHVDAVGCVLHFDPPEDAKAYVHRSGRTGRAGAGGTVLSLVTADQAAAVRALQKGPRLQRQTDRSRPGRSRAGRAGPGRADGADADEARREDSGQQPARAGPQGLAHRGRSAGAAAQARRPARPGRPSPGAETPGGLSHPQAATGRAPMTPTGVDNTAARPVALLRRPAQRAFSGSPQAAGVPPANRNPCLTVNCGNPGYPEVPLRTTGRS